MSLRMGVTVQDELKIKRMVNAGESWADIAAELSDCDLDYVKANFYTPFKKQADAAEAALSDDIGPVAPPKK